MPALAAGLSLRILHAEAIRDFLGDMLHLQSDPASIDVTPFLELSQVGFMVEAGIANAMPIEPPDGE
jgi:hypothetical protein